MEVAFGAPGIGPTWMSSANDLVTTALGPSRLWATVGFGILNEVYWPATGLPQIRDLGFIAAGEGGWFEVKRVNRYRISTPAPHLPLPCTVHEGEGYRLTLEFLPASLRDALLVSYRLEGDGLRLYPLLAPHLGGSGRGNSAWTGDGLYAVKGEQALCLLAGAGFARASAGYVGASDGWQDFAQHGQMTWQFARATDGNVALIGELEATEGVLALAFAETPQGARTLAASALAEGYAPIRARFVEGWERWASCLELPQAVSELERQARQSATVLKIHGDRTYPGAIVASLSVPWGNTSDDPGGYHLVWTRDAVEAGLALLAAGDRPSARRTLAYLAATQAPDGHWSQNFYPDGRPFWTGIQLDEVGFPILFAAKLRDLGEDESTLIGPMVQHAAAYLARAGPVSPQDRWEESPGASPFTLAVSIAALTAAATYWLDGAEREYALALADCWNERIEEWTYVAATELARTRSVAGYYVRIGPPAGVGGLRGSVEVANRGGETLPASALVGHLPPLRRRRLRRRRRRKPLRRQRHRPRLAAAGGRARPRCAPPRRTRRTVPGGDGAHDRAGRPDPRAGLGQRPDPRAHALPGQTDRQRDAARLGARRIPQAAPRPRDWQAHRAVRRGHRAPRAQAPSRCELVLAHGGAGRSLAARASARDRERRAVRPPLRLRRLAERRRASLDAARVHHARRPARAKRARGPRRTRLHPTVAARRLVGRSRPHGRAPGRAVAAFARATAAVNITRPRRFPYTRKSATGRGCYTPAAASCAERNSRSARFQFSSSLPASSDWDISWARAAICSSVTVSPSDEGACSVGSGCFATTFLSVRRDALLWSVEATRPK
jgi:GH15 family glucan-1,4-alpha-glucosidase